MSDAETPADCGLRRFMGVDLIDFLGKIAKKVIVHNPDDWNIDKKALLKAALSDNPDERWLMWRVSRWGTNLNMERITFIKETAAFNCWVDNSPNDPDACGYVVEVTEKNGQRINGNVFEVGDYAEHAKYVRETALPLDSVTLFYSGDWGVNAGKTITVPHYEYDADYNRLMSESGNVTAIRYHPSESVREMSALLQQEHSRRIKTYPIGSQEAHLLTLEKKLDEIRQRYPPLEFFVRPVKSLAAKLEAATEKVKAQYAQNKSSSNKRKERE